MAEGLRETWITGLGMISCLGEGPQAHWQRLQQGGISDDDGFAPPFRIHRLGAVDFDKQIPKKGDQRQMEPWQRIGTYAAGLALDEAGVKGDADVLGRMDLIVAAAGGERDLAVDAAILTGLPKAADPARFLNERLTSDLRPTLFLAQLSNLLAGNISIVHGVTGSSRTFMGEETAGVNAVRIALARIAAGQSDIALVGGAHNAERKDQLALYGFAGLNWSGAATPVWERGPKGGLALGAMGAFLVLEAREHAEARNARPVARLARVLADQTRRQAGMTTAALRAMWQRLGVQSDPDTVAVISGASGAEPATREERDFLIQDVRAPVRATGTYLGHAMEPQFLMNVAIASLVVKNGALFPPGSSAVEQAFTGTPRQAVVTSVGHWRGEGMALVEAV